MSTPPLQHSLSPLAERLEHAVRRALPLWSLSPASDVSLLAISENVTWLVSDAASDRRVVIRVHRPGYHTKAEIESEHAWIHALRERGTVDTPALVPLRDGGWLGQISDGDLTRYAVAFEFMTGRAPAETEDLTNWFMRLGGISARLHQHARTWPLPAGFTRKSWNYDTTVGPIHYWGEWQNALGLHELGPEARALLQRVCECLHRRLACYGETLDRFGLVHADLRLANLLVDGERLGVIDFDDCGFSWHMYDFAAAVSFFEHSPVVPALMDAWIAGYAAVHPLAAEHVNEIPVMVMLRRMLLTAWIATHAETPTAQAAGIGAYTHGTLALAEIFLTRYG